ncbi:MAG: flavin reductase [Eubacteriaceae bacterium]|nr:flavin reductase [Eubacteriaceae bacterium]
MKQFNISAFEVYDKQWALVTAGNTNDYNTMTISWGGVGTLWNKPVVTVYIRPSRHTFGYIENNEYFTVSFYGEEFKKDLGTLGRLSGRDGDKVAQTSLTVTPAGESVTFEQAETTLVCKKLYYNDIVKENIPEDIRNKNYASDEPAHRMYVAEVVDIITK